MLYRHDAQFVAEIEMDAARGGRQEADHVEAHRLGVKNIAPDHLPVFARMEFDGGGPNTVPAFEKNPMAVEPEIPVGEIEIAEAAPDRLLIRRRAALGLEPRRNPVQKRVVQRPQPVLGHAQLSLENALARGRGHFQCRLTCIFPAGCGSDRQPEPDLARLFSGIAERRADLDLARLPIRDSIQIVDPNPETLNPVFWHLQGFCKRLRKVGRVPPNPPWTPLGGIPTKRRSSCPSAAP